MSIVRTVDLRSIDFDPERAFRVLVDHGVDFVVIGGVAAVLRGAGVATVDMDVALADDDANRERAAAALRTIGATLLVEIDPVGMTGTTFDLPIDASTLRDVRPTRLVTTCGVVDVVHDAAAIGGYDGWISGAGAMELGDLSIVVASLDDLIASKRAAGRPKDLRVLPFLAEARRLQGGAAGEDEQRGPSRGSG